MSATDLTKTDIDRLIAEDQELIREARRQREEGMRVLGRVELALERSRKALDRMAEELG
jgi:hypothetical protein